MKCNGFPNRSRLAALSIAAAVAALVGLQAQTVAAADARKANEKSVQSDKQQNAASDAAKADQGNKAANSAANDEQAKQPDQAASNERDQAGNDRQRGESKPSADRTQQRSQRGSRDRDAKDEIDRDSRRGSNRDQAAENRRDDRSEPRREIRNYRPDTANENQGNRDRQGSSARNRATDRDRSGSRENFGVSFSGDGMVIGKVKDRSLADRAHLRSGDEIVSINGHRVSSNDEFDRWAYDVDRGEPISIIVLRDGQRETMRVEPQEGDRVHYNYDTDADRGAPGEVAFLGVLLDDGYDDGALVQSVQPGSPAEDAGLRQGDIIRSINGERVRSPDELAGMVRRMDPGSNAEIEYSRRQSGVVNVELGAKQARGRSSEDEEQRFSRDPSRDSSYQDDQSQDSRSRGEANWRGPQRGEDLERDDGAELRSGERGADNRLRDEDAGRLRMRRDNGGLLPRLRNR